MTSGNAIYDDLVSKDLPEIDDFDVFSSIKHLDEEYLENIFSIIVCYFVRECYDKGITIEETYAFLQNYLPYGGEYIIPEKKKGIRFELKNLPEILTKIIVKYLTDYFR